MHLLCLVIFVKEAAFFLVGIAVDGVLQLGLVTRIQSGRAGRRDPVELAQFALAGRQAGPMHRDISTTTQK